MPLKVHLFLLVTVLFFNSGESLSCYTCTANVGQNSGCEKISGDSVQTQPCTGSDVVCVKYKMKNTASLIETVSRKCSAANICDTLKQSETEFNKLTECRTCQRDACDSAEFLHFSLATFLVTLIMTTVL